MHTLGSGHNSAFIYDRYGETRLATLPSASTVEWGRAISEVTAGTALIPLRACTRDLDRIHTWAHTLVIYRDAGTGGAAERVWEGPIRRKTSTAAGVLISATDVLGYTQRRMIRTARKLPAPAAVVPEMEWSVEEAFALDDPNVLPYLTTIGSGPDVDRDVARYSAYHADDLGTLTGAGGRYTVLGRKIILFHDATDLGRTKDLRPEDHLLADVEVVEDGDSLGTWAVARDDNGVSGTHAAAGAPAGVDPFYGQVDLSVSAGPGKHRRQQLVRRARATVQANYPAREVLTIPADAQLRIDSPFPIRGLVPGVLVPVESTTATGRKISATMVLSSMKVTQNGGADESVSITLIPYTSTAA